MHSRVGQSAAQRLIVFLRVGDMLTVLTVMWILSTAAAAVIANDRGRSGIAFGVVTFFCLGPLGPGFALIATHGRIERMQLQAAWAADPRTGQRTIAEGRRRCVCPQCGAENDIPLAEMGYDCWRCSISWKLERKAAEAEAPG
jgi:hypothetical protein